MALSVHIAASLTLASLILVIMWRLRSLLSKLRRCFNRSIAEEAEPPTFPLPLDILFLIADELPPLPLRCLALTCKGVYFHLSPLFSREALSEEDKRTLLLDLEKEIPEVYYCFDCRRLHRWDPSWTIHNFRHHRPLGEHYVSKLNLPGLRLDHPLMRLVMNRHLYGPAHGLELRSIEANNQIICSKERIIYLQTWRARIIHDELILRSVNTIWHTHNDPAKLREFIDKGGKEMVSCWHVCVRDTDPSNHRWGLETASDRVAGMQRPVDEVSEGYFAACDRLTSRCATCESDFETDIRWTKPPSGRKGWVVTITGYHRLGDTRDPMCPRLDLLDFRWFRVADRGRDPMQPSPRLWWLEAERQDPGPSEKLRVRTRREHDFQIKGQRDGHTSWW
ncbi:hypothetical protein B0T11DRAFT_357267 [Plectosphaerella cucumerina]|uniref:F-box domain-containing protein n=1 Tax=Plectosphaerella cucumerina TaxID=40658 RepID=A0A8K0TBJ0_9PEZI|nr:hypothetical protein B0T11DRAFT_357267 [Plectosphaerella cucumerina]